MIRIDHAIYGVADLDAAAGRFEREFGLGSVPGGTHPAFGTANRIVPLGEGYLELMGIADRAVAEDNPLGRHVLEQTATADRWLGWVVATDDPEGVAARLHETVVPGMRARPDGSTVSWRAVAMASMLLEPPLPFFIAWDDPRRHPGRDAAEHRVAARGIAWIEVAGDPARIAEWLGDDDVAVRVVPGAPGVRAVAVATAGAEIVVR